MMEEYETCHSIGITGNCGLDCPVLQRGDCDVTEEMYNCPLCGENFLEFGTSEIKTKEAIATVSWAICNLEYDDGHYCGFFIINESKDKMIQKIKSSYDEFLVLMNR